MRDWNREKLILAGRSASETFSSIGAAFGFSRQRAHSIWSRNQPQAAAATVTVERTTSGGMSELQPTTVEAA
ncbi:hypothetical protein [Tahibacter sp.]|uniref:hypothetical protein n=1 Tax=Tahibacter sp. TaxID=2056211 RepID=UPI0028C4F51E|nr:hypothetical protein [Tahibacter sp.]